jgi:LPS export ABC transporter protein LptC
MNKFNYQNKYLKGAAFFLSCFFFIACENDQKTIDEWTQNKVMVEEAKSIEVFMSESGRMKAKLTAPYMLRYTSDTIMVEFPQTLHADFFDSSAKVESQLNCRYGKYYESLNKVYLRDSVVVFNIYGDSLYTPELWWDQNSQKLYTEKKVRIRKSGSLFFGIGMEAKQDLSDIHIKQITNSTLQVPDSLSGN